MSSTFLLSRHVAISFLVSTNLFLSNVVSTSLLLLSLFSTNLNISQSLSGVSYSRALAVRVRSAQHRSAAAAELVRHHELTLVLLYRELGEKG